MKIDVELICRSCSDINEDSQDNDYTMLGEEIFYTNKETGTQCRKYTCGYCDTVVEVILKEKKGE